MILQHSLTLRLTCFFSIATVVVITGLSWFINHAIEGYFLQEDRVLLENKMHMVEEMILRTHFNNDFSEILKKVEKIEGMAIQIDNPEDQITLYTTDNMRFPTSVLTNKRPFSSYAAVPNNMSSQTYSALFTMPSQRNDLVQWQDKDNFYRGMQFHLTLKNANHSAVILTLAINIDHHRNFLLSFRAALIEFTIIAGIISALLGWLVTYQGLLPLKILTKKATLVVSMKDIQQRMPVDNLPIEIAGLSETLNNMLGRLEDAFRRLENFSSDIAHELRTPINNLMMQTQVSLSKPRAKDEYLTTLASNAEEFDRLARMISDMLFLAKTDNELTLLSTEVIYLEEEIANLFEFYEALAEESNITLTLKGEAELQGDKLMLRRAFSNLISNAIRHSFAGGEINIKICPCKQNVIVEVSNYGPTIPVEDLPHLFERFYRADKSRQFCAYERVGLGLAITQSIAKAHRGNVYVSSEEQLTTFTFIINKGR